MLAYDQLLANENFAYQNTLANELAVVRVERAAADATAALVAQQAKEDAWAAKVYTYEEKQQLLPEIARPSNQILENGGYGFNPGAGLLEGYDLSFDPFDQYIQSTDTGDGTYTHVSNIGINNQLTFSGTSTWVTNLANDVTWGTFNPYALYHRDNSITGAPFVIPQGEMQAQINYSNISYLGLIDNFNLTDSTFYLFSTATGKVAYYNSDYDLTQTYQYGNAPTNIFDAQDLQRYSLDTNNYAWDFTQFTQQFNLEAISIDEDPEAPKLEVPEFEDIDLYENILPIEEDEDVSTQPLSSQNTSPPKQTTASDVSKPSSGENNSNEITKAAEKITKQYVTDDEVKDKGGNHIGYYYETSAGEKRVKRWSDSLQRWYTLLLETVDAENNSKDKAAWDKQFEDNAHIYIDKDEYLTTPTGGSSRSIQGLQGYNGTSAAWDWAETVSDVTIAFGKGLITGSKAIINGSATAVVNFVTLGLNDKEIQLIHVTEEDRQAGYDTAVKFATAGGEILIGVSTGGAATYLANGGKIARVASGAIVILDTGGNIVGFLKGAVSIYNNGLTVANTVQTTANGLGIALNASTLRGLAKAADVPIPSAPLKEGTKQLDNTQEVFENIIKSKNTPDAPNSPTKSAEKAASENKLDAEDLNKSDLNKPNGILSKIDEDQWCFSPETLVKTTSGNVTIDKISIGDQVYSFNFDNGNWEICVVLRVHRNIYSGVWVKIEFAGKSIEVTHNHPFWVVSGNTISSRESPRHLDVALDENKTISGRWVNSQDLQVGDELLSYSGEKIKITDVENTNITEQTVYNLTVKEHHTFAVSELEILVHNETWCEILEKQFGWRKPIELIRLINSGIKNVSNGVMKTLSAIHGHHIVMKAAIDKSSVASRKILEDYGIKVFYTVEELKKAKPDELHNMSMAINGYKGIHTEKYADAVLERLQKAVNKGGTEAQIRDNIINELADMREILQKGRTFWNYVEPN